MSILQVVNTGQIAASAATKPEGVAEASTEDFGAMLARFASESIGTIQQGEIAATGGLSGTVPVQEVVQKVMAAEQALHTGIALRDKIVAAYLEISRMTI